MYRLLLLSAFLSPLAYADCDLKKAGRNKLLDHKIGISGKCDTETALKNEAIKKTDSVLNIDTKKTTEKITTIRSEAGDLVTEIKKTSDGAIKSAPVSER